MNEAHPESSALLLPAKLIVPVVTARIGRMNAMIQVLERLSLVSSALNIELYLST